MKSLTFLSFFPAATLRFAYQSVQIAQSFLFLFYFFILLKMFVRRSNAPVSAALEQKVGNRGLSVLFSGDP